MNYGLIALIIVQVALAGVCAIAAVRLWNVQSAYERVQVAMESRVTLAEATAAAAKQMVESMEVTHYKALQARQLATETDVGSYRVQLDSLVESMASLSAKLASREKLERKAAKAEPAEPVAATEPEIPVTLEQLIAQGHAMPMGAAEVPTPSRNGSFGARILHKG